MGRTAGRKDRLVGAAGGAGGRGAPGEDAEEGGAGSVGVPHTSALDLGRPGVPGPGEDVLGAWYLDALCAEHGWELPGAILLALRVPSSHLDFLLSLPLCPCSGLK